MSAPSPTAPAWSNWSGGVRCEPREVLRPRDEDGIVRAVRRAAETGAVLRTTGSGHSFSPVVATDGVLVSLEEWTGVESVDAAARRATIRAGTRLSALGEPLRAHGLALANQGDVDVQSLGGAIGTGTHGTGPTLGSLSTQAVAVRLATADGRVRTWGDDDGDRLDAARVSLGLFGVAIAYTLQLVPAYRLHERTWRGGVEDAMARLDENVAAHRHYEFFWWPSRDLVEHKSLDPTELPVGADVGRHQRVDWSDRVFPSVRDLRFEEMEYAVPVEAGPACFLEVRERMRSRHGHVEWPVEFRTLAADRSWIGPAGGRATVTISLHQGADLPCEDFFRDCEPIFLAHGGRPHWGKRHFRDGAWAQAAYPSWERFAALRRELDPHGAFLSKPLRPLFEPVA